MTISPNFFRKTVSKAMVFLVALTCLQSQSFLLHTAHAADSTISGKTFYDSNKNGINDEGDQILPFLKVSLYDGATLVQGPISIDTTGTYQFTLSSVGNYHVEFSNLPPNYSFSPSNIGSDETLDSDVTSVDGLGTGSTSDMFVIGSQTVTDVDAGAYVDTVHIGDYMFQDSNSNGIQDSGDTVLTGATASLYNYNSGTLGTDTTDIAGHYGINATIPTCIGPNAFWNSGNSNMDCTGINVAGGFYDLTFSTSADCQDFVLGITLQAANGSTLFDGTCGSGVADLKNNTTYNFRVGPELGTGTAHLNFTEMGSSHGIGNIMLSYSKLVVTFSGLPMGYGFTSKFTGADRTVDSDVNSDGNTDVLMLFAGDSSDEIDAGICNPCAPSGPSGSISGIVWNDANNNGLYESTSESQYGGVNIGLYNANTDTIISGQGSTGSGPFTFSGLSAGDYYVVFGNIPPSAAFSPPNVGEDDTVDSDADASGRTGSFHLSDGESVTNLSAGVYGVGGGGGGGASGSISGIVWNDANNNGLYESASESQYSGINIGLFNANTDSEINDQGTSGFPYSFSGLSEGDYYLIFRGIPPTATFSPQNGGDDDTVDSDVDAYGRTGSFHLSNGQSVTNLSAGIYSGGGGGGGGGGDGTLQFHVFTDTNGNGIQDMGEPDGNGSTITLSNGSDSMDISTNEQGNVNNTLPPFNNYSLTFNPPPASYVTARNNPITPITVFSNQTTNLGNIGIYTGPVGFFQLHLFTDNNNNGTQDEGEQDGAPGVSLVLNNNFGSPIPFPENGSFNAPLAPDTYTFSIVTNSESAIITGMSEALPTVTISASTTNGLGNIGYFDSQGGGTGTLAAHIFTDTNGNGVQDMGEPDGAPGEITVSQGEDWMVLTPDPSGHISQMLPASGGYVLTFALPELYVTARNNPISDISIFGGQLTDLGNIGVYGGPVGEFHLHLFTDNNNNGVQDEGEVDGAPKVYLIINGHDESPIPFQTNGYFNAKLAPGDYSFSLIAYTEEAVTFTGNILGLSAVSIQEDMISSLGNIGYFTGTGGGGGGGGSPEDCGHVEDQCGDVHFRIFSDTNGNGMQDSGEPNNAPGTQIHIQNTGTGGLDATISPESDGSVSGTIPTGNYALTVIPASGYSVTGGSSTIGFSINDNQLTDLGTRGIYAGSGGSGSGSDDSCDSPCGMLTFHIFTDTNGNGTQESYEPNGATGTSVRVQGGDFDQVVALDAGGNIGGDVYPTSYTLTIIKPAGTTVTGGSNPIHVTVADGDSVNAGSRGIFITTTGGSGGGGGSVVFGGGSSGGSSNQSSGWTSRSSSSNRSSSNSSDSSSATKQSQVAETPTPQTQTLPVITPHEEACLLTGGTTPINFYDGSTPDTDYLSGIIFNHNAANRLLHGDGNGHFAGNLPMTRFELLKVAMSSNCVAGGNFNTPNSHFSDVNHDQSEQSRVIGEAHARGIITGLNDQFYPNRPVTLGELMKILLGSSAYFPNGIPVANLPLTETGITEPSFIQPIEYAKLLGIIGEDGKPIDQNRVVTRDEMAILIARYIKAMNHLVIAN